MICASPNRPFFIVNLLRYLAEKILLLNTTNFRGDYPTKRRTQTGEILLRYNCDAQPFLWPIIAVRFTFGIPEASQTRLDGTITTLRAKLARLDLLIIDDFALCPMSKKELTDILEIIEGRSSQSSIIMVAQRSPQEW